VLGDFPTLLKDFMTWIKPTDKARVALLQSYPRPGLLMKHPNLSSVISGRIQRSLSARLIRRRSKRKPVTTSARNLIPRLATYIAGGEV
jgi:hypothetical protein